MKKIHLRCENEAKLYTSITARAGTACSLCHCNTSTSGTRVLTESSGEEIDKRLRAHVIHKKGH